jgi:hypothetical protein
VPDLLPAKPADLYLGVVDLFGALIPGVLLAATLSPYADSLFEHEVVPPPSSELATVATYLVAGWVLGLVLRALGELLDLTIYDKWYIPAFKRRPEIPPRSQPERSDARPRWRVRDKLRFAWTTVWDRAAGKNASDPLLHAASLLAEAQVKPLGGGVPLGLFGWAQVEVARADPAAAVAADRLTADSKFFRSLIFVALAALLVSDRSPVVVLGCAGFAVVALAAYCRFRWKATTILYRSYVQLRLGAGGDSPGSA